MGILHRNTIRISDDARCGLSDLCGNDVGLVDGGLNNGLFVRVEAFGKVFVEVGLFLLKPYRT